MAQTTHFRFGDSNANCGNITGSFNITSNFNRTVYKSDEDARIMHWLSPLEPSSRHQGVRSERFDGVGDWLLETSEFRKWRGGEGGADEAILFCSGNPGVGKTYLSSLVIDSLCDQAKQDVIVACFYCDFLAQQEQTVINMMGAILKQLVGGGGIPEHLCEAFQEGKEEIGGRGLLLPDLMKFLGITIASLPQVFICIDALDECLPKHLPELLKSLRVIVREFPRTRIFLTGRPHVKEDVQRYFTGAVVIPISPNTDDIRNYLQMRLDGDADPEAMNDNLRADIIGAILEKISDIFLLVSLNVDAILGEVTIRQRRKKLEEMTKGNGLSDAYTATLARLKAQKGNKSILGMKVLMWVSHSERPLRAGELCHALGVEVGSTDLDVENVPALRTLLASCLGLVTVEASSSTIRLVHFTLQEHLSSDPTLFHNPHSSIAEVCLTYLDFECVRSLSPTLRSAPTTTPLLEYASCYWGDHARRGVTENVKALGLRLLSRFDEHISAQLMLSHHNRDSGAGPYFEEVRGPLGFTGLHGVAFLGVVGIVAAILKMKEWDVNATDCTGSTALTWAAGRGHGEVVKMLLEREDVDPDQADTFFGRTPLSWAAGSGHEGVVKMLLERGDVSPDQLDTLFGQTPLSRAAGSGHEGVVKILLERGDVNPDRPDTSGETPLSRAAGSGYEGVVKMLLERGNVNPDRLDTFGQTPLSRAAWSGHEGVVKMLLERGDVDPDHPDAFGQTPLLWAAGNGHEGVVNMLLERGDVDPDQVDTRYGRTPLSWAAGNGHEGVVKVLLERGDVNPDQTDTKYGQTPLSRAAGNGHEGAVKVLLGGDVDPNQVDTRYGQTPLSWAAGNGHEGVVKTLLERGDANPDHPDAFGQTPLSRAAGYGHEGVVKTLLRRKYVRTATPDSLNQTPLPRALSSGHHQVVRMLRERDDVDSDTADRAG